MPDRTSLPGGWIVWRDEKKKRCSRGDGWHSLNITWVELSVVVVKHCKFQMLILISWNLGNSEPVSNIRIMFVNFHYTRSFGLIICSQPLQVKNVFTSVDRGVKPGWKLADYPAACPAFINQRKTRQKTEVRFGGVGRANCMEFLSLIFLKYIHRALKCVPTEFILTI